MWGNGPTSLGDMGVGMTETDQKLEDDVLRRMLATPPSPHKPPAKRTGLTPMKRGKPKGANK